MTRYFPELFAAFRSELPARCVVDGEIVLATEAGLDFEALQKRIHPAASRVALLSTQTPASFIAFDLLTLGDDDLTGQPFVKRRAALEKALHQARPPVHLTPQRSDLHWVQNQMRSGRWAIAVTCVGCEPPRLREC
jgi:ATP-dependent DNA ligase